MKRRDFALLAATGVAVAATGEAAAEMFGGRGSTFHVTGTGDHISAKSGFNPDGTPNGGLWNCHNKGESLMKFLIGGTGQAVGTAISNIGVILDPARQGDLKLVAHESSRWRYDFRYKLTGNNGLEIYIVPGSHNVEVVGGPRKGAKYTVAWQGDDPNKAAMKGFISADRKILLLGSPTPIPVIIKTEGSAEVEHGLRSFELMGFAES